MSKKFTGKEQFYSFANKEVRVRITEDENGGLEKVVLISGKKNIVLTAAELAIAAFIARDNESGIRIASGENMADDIEAKEICREVWNQYVRDQSGDNWKIPAIKAYREITRVGLKEAKEAVEYMQIFGFDKFLAKVWAPYKSGNWKAVSDECAVAVAVIRERRGGW